MNDKELKDLYDAVTDMTNMKQFYMEEDNFKEFIESVDCEIVETDDEIIVQKKEPI